MNQQAISIRMDALNSHLIMTNLELEGDTRGLVLMQALQQPSTGTQCDEIHHCRCCKVGKHVSKGGGARPS